MPSYRRGSIVWVEITDPQGKNPKCRPAVILTPDEEISADTPLVVIGISTDVEHAPPGVSIALPWQRGGHPRTGLKAPSVAICTWQKEIQLSDIQESAGTVPGKQLLEILRILASLPT